MRNDAIAILFLALFVVTCGDEESPGPGPPPILRPVSIRIEGSSQLALREESEFKAVQTWSDGSTHDVTLRAQWSSTNPAVLTVSAGFARALEGGEVGVTAQLDGITSQPRSVRVVPAVAEWNGTYILNVGGGPCSGSRPLPDELRERRYAASVRQDGLTLTVSVDRVGEFGGRIVNPQVRFSFPGFSGSRVRRAFATETLPDVLRVSYRKAAYSGPVGFVERLPDRNRLEVTGEVMATITPSSGFTGTLNGALTLYEPSLHNVLGVCASSSHGFALVRR